jgi:hypothetical protein
MVSVLSLFNGLISVDFGILKAEVNPDDLNVLFKSTFDDYDAILTKWMDINGTFVDLWDLSRGGSNSSLSTIGFYIFGLIQMYNSSRDEYYLSKLRSIVDTVIDDSLFYTNTDIGEIFYPPQFYYDGQEQDATPKLAMAYAIASIYLYKWTGATKYKELADRVANETMQLIVVNNSTDMAWSCAYHLFRTEAYARNAVNRQAFITWFHTLYGKELNSTYTSYVSKELNWQFKAQKASGAFAYNIDDDSTTLVYTGFHTTALLSGYYVDSTGFTAYDTQIQNVLTWMEKQEVDDYIGINVIGTLAMGWKNGFNVDPNRTKALMYIFLNALQYAEKGVGTKPSLEQILASWRHSQYDLGMIFNSYPLPDATLTGLDRVNVEYTGNLNPELILTRKWKAGTELYGNIRVNWMYGVGNYHKGNIQRPQFFLAGRYQGIPITTITNGTYYIHLSHDYGSGDVVDQYYYFTGLTVFIFTGSKTFSYYRDGITTQQVDIYLSNGTSTTLQALGNITEALDTKFIIKEHARDNYFFIKADDDTWTNFIDSSYIELKRTVSNARIGCMLLYSLNYSLAEAFAAFDRISDIIDEPHPLSYATVMQAYTNFTRYVLHQKFGNSSESDTIYRKPKDTPAKLVGISQPQQVNLTEWTYSNDTLTIGLTANTGITSTTKVYCGDKGQPVKVSGALSWDYDNTTKILGIVVAHSSSETIEIRWLTGDIDSDGDVDWFDFGIFAAAYGTSEGDPDYKPEADFVGDPTDPDPNIPDGDVDWFDFGIFAGNYGMSA